MKRLTLLTITAFLAVVLSACGESAEKKAENNAATQTQDNSGVAAQPGAENPSDTTKTGQ